LIRRALLALAGFTTVGAQAQYPTRPVRFIVPQPPGGGADIVGRIAALKLQETLGQQFVVDNRSGAGGIVGAEIVARAPADGYTVLLGFTGLLTILPSLNRNLPYRTLEDFAPVSVAAATPLILTVNPGLKAATMNELIAVAKARTAPLTYGSPGNGSLHHLSTEWMKSALKLDLTHVPYKGVNSFNAVMAGEVGMAFVSVVGGFPHVKSGRVKAVAITTKTRSPLLPDVPPLADTIAGFDAANWFGVLAPRATPEVIVNRLAQALATGMRADDVRQRLLKDGADVVANTPAQFAELMRNETKRWAEVVRVSGARVD
jgi:tripartite-type tricarboxylate transporter receptor subunit TctC